MKTKLETLIEEAKLQAEAHPSKDARWFANSVHDYLTQRTWVGLTDEEKDGKRVLENIWFFNTAEVQVWKLAVQWAEAKLKEKNT